MTLCLRSFTCAMRPGWLAAGVSASKFVPKKEDPMEKFCGDNPDADECRVFED